MEFGVRGIKARQSAYQGHVSSFSKVINSNSGNEDKIDLISLTEKLTKKRKKERKKEIFIKIHMYNLLNIHIVNNIDILVS